MRYKVQSSWFPGDYGSWNTDVAEFDNLEEAIKYIKENDPPEECNWDIIDVENRNHTAAFTRVYYNELFIWEDKKYKKTNCK